MRSTNLSPRNGRVVAAVVFALLTALALTACAGARTVVVGAKTAVGVARIISQQGSAPVIRQSPRFKVTPVASPRTAAELARLLGAKPKNAKPRIPASPAASGGEPIPAPNDSLWKFVIKREVKGRTEAEVYQVDGGKKLFVYTNGRTSQSLEPGRNLIVIEALTDSTVVALMDSDTEPVRRTGTFFISLALKNGREFDFDHGKRSGKSKKGDLRVGFATSAVNGARIAEMGKRPSLADCLTVKPGDWVEDIPAYTVPWGHYCLLTSEGRFGTVNFQLGNNTYTVWQTAPEK
ncbi:hypothetical protein [Streptomyces albipurpureus]|uniref:Lipoprotein n=1 Tax=Streptomyces albipurpureus TaxID=2897419 RepID=A0ABT0UKV7_9ACTN|nr:hypothetical protein [Streptomyces sp. CWNU-1]MCM2388240.1 hypothetical protein [Streptomyces sp. CWNU-1]